jgi:hypothetical protein
MEDKEIRQLEEFAEKVKANYSIEYNLEGIKRLEEEITKNRNAFQNWAEGHQDAWVFAFGAFIGKCMILNYGGQWVKHEDTIGIKLENSDFFANPFSKVSKQFQPDGMYDSITSFYEISKNIDNIVSRQVKTGTKTIRKAWWKIW